MDKGVLLVTGASRGIGAATALRAAADGWDVAVNYARDKAAAETVAQGVTAAGRRALVVACDIAKPADVEALFATVDSELGPLAGLVNNAGTTGQVKRVDEMTAGDIAGVFDLNVTGLMLCCGAAVRRMSTRHGGQGGVIVNLGSIAARLGAAGEFVHYAGSKGAVESITLGLAREVAGEGVRVNAVAPGMIDTEIHASAGAPDRVARLGPTVPQGRAGTAEEVAEAVVWLLSDAARYCAGSIIDVSGGR